MIHAHYQRSPRKPFHYLFLQEFLWGKVPHLLPLYYFYFTSELTEKTNFHRKGQKGRGLRRESVGQKGPAFLLGQFPAKRKEALMTKMDPIESSYCHYPEHGSIGFDPKELPSLGPKGGVADFSSLR
jgi:hypothetical protein